MTEHKLQEWPSRLEPGVYFVRCLHCGWEGRSYDRLDGTTTTKYLVPWPPCGLAAPEPKPAGKEG